MSPNSTPRPAQHRIGVIVGVVAGFAVGATGFAAAQHGDLTPPPALPTALDDPTTTLEDDPASTIVDEGDDADEMSDSTLVDDDDAEDDDGPSTSVDDGADEDDGAESTLDGADDEGVDDDEGPSTSVDDDDDADENEGPDTTVSGVSVTSIEADPATTLDMIPDSTVDDDGGPSTSVDDDDESDDDGGPSTSVDDDDESDDGAGLPAPFTTSYSAAGGSIGVTWTGTALSIDSISPLPGIRAEIEDNSWDKVRVDFEGDGHESRIEVRIDDGQLRVRID